MISMQDIFVHAAYAGAVLTIVAFIIGTWVHRKLQNDRYERFRRFGVYQESGLVSRS